MNAHFGGDWRRCTDELAGLAVAGDVAALEASARLQLLAIAERDRTAQLEATSSPSAFVDSLLELPRDSLKDLLGVDLCRRLYDRLEGL